MQLPKVLLVNDDAASLYALENLLLDGAARQEYQLMTAGSGQAALRAVLRHEFAVILLDVSMPDMNGFETAETIHGHPRSVGVPIIFITAHFADELHRLKAYQKGAADYLFTPVIPQILQAKVAVFVDMAEKNLRLRRQSEELARLNQDLRVQRLQDLERINGELEQEVAERKLAEQRAHELATRDALTGLLNRRSLIQQLDHALAAAERGGTQCALLFLDLDRFKAINDRYGHEAGDALLRQVAARLSASVRTADTVARLGGDEFVVLLESPNAAANAAKVAHKIEQAHTAPFELANARVATSTSIGIALYPQDGATAQALLRHADLAMYHAKQHERGGIVFFHEELNVRERERACWTAELQAALAHGELALRHAPQARLDGDATTVDGVEAELRWRHPRLGWLDAAQFLPHIDDRALLDRVDGWTFDHACAQLAAWRDAAPAVPMRALTLNLATPQLHADAVASLLAAIARHDLAAGALTLDLGETLLLAPQAGLAPLLRQLRDGGVRLALDHFDNPRSSLAACKKLGLDQLKLGAALVHAIGDDAGGTDIVAAVAYLARALKLQLVALGVETDTQLAVLRGLGCQRYQGPLLAALPDFPFNLHAPHEDAVDE